MIHPQAALSAGGGPGAPTQPDPFKPSSTRLSDKFEKNSKTMALLQLILKEDTFLCDETKLLFKYFFQIIMVFEISAEGSDLIEKEEVKMHSPYIPSLESSTKTGFRTVEFNFNWYTFRVLFQGKFL